MFALIEAKPAEQDVAKYCQASSISKAAYYYWLKKYRQRMSGEQPSSGFIPVQLFQPGNTALASVILAGGTVINVYHPEVFPYLHSLL